ncbi:MAG: sensor histidine kinase [Bacteroidales bacterium]
MKSIIKGVVTKRSLPEGFIYIMAWVIVFLFPLADNLIDFLTDSVETMRWSEILRSWKETLPFFLLFLLNNQILLPHLFLKKKITIYIISATICSLLFVSVSTLISHNQPPPKIEFRGSERVQPHIQGDHPRTLQKEEQGHIDKRDNKLQPLHQRPRPLILPMMRGPLIGKILLAILMLSFNIAVRLFFKSIKDDEAMKELENHNLHSELEYLKYQINPHFFMNTLNNIHALVDIDAEKAKETIVELSKLMRYLLYESNNKSIPLKKEIEFLRNYVELMRIRFAESVVITFNITCELSTVQIPPLLLISFVENAFKHGVSYQQSSFISITIEIDRGRLIFSCLNSNFGKKRDNHHGIGLDNIRKRLELLYKDNYELSIREHENSFDVILEIPIENQC